jgi:uncharacterized protein
MALIKETELRLKEWFELHPRVLVALSGGVDSCLVAYLARKLNGKKNAIALIGVSPSLKKRDLDLAIGFCLEHDIQYLKVFPNEIEDENYSSNPKNRCYYCKSALYSEMLVVQQLKYNDFDILNGNNYSDRGDYRPGMEAAKEKNALSPLADCGVEKEMIRELSNAYGLSVWNKPASPCLSSRFHYGEAITVSKLHMVEQAEELVNNLGHKDVRVRIKNMDAKIEVPHSEVVMLKSQRDYLYLELQRIGFNKVEIDEEGLISGKLNREIDTKA